MRLSPLNALRFPKATVYHAVNRLRKFKFVKYKSVYVKMTRLTSKICKFFTTENVEYKNTSLREKETLVLRIGSHFVNSLKGIAGNSKGSLP